eukprot:TRINITY_DN7361_c0_g1_i1.p1 TRINITY_DN7361_c0_g1~~TRINITY_DN7361_c0_g1_i1.p1  ORF type:complete len:174 (+),score=13.97 TRINITY_DN7361_c0_g1_i1:154-675(+)
MATSIFWTKVCLVLTLTSVTFGLGLDKAAALLEYQPDASCATNSICEDVISATLCSMTCGTDVDPCSDNNAALNTYWTNTISAADGIMTCSRARAALKCNDLVIKGLCAKSCLVCHENIHPDTDEAATVDPLFYRYNSLVLDNERRQTQWQCAKDREAADYDCDTLAVKCPLY